MNDSTEGFGRVSDAAPPADGRAGRNDVRLDLLKLLIPYVRRYQAQAIGAGVALIVAAVLVLPLLLVAFMPDQSAAVAPQRLWHLAMAHALIAFILAVHPRLKSRSRLAIDAPMPSPQYAS